MKHLSLTAALHLFYLFSCYSQGSPPGITTVLVSPRSTLTAALPAGRIPPLTIHVVNGQTTRSLANVVLEWQILINGRTAQSGRIGKLLAAGLPVAAQRSGNFSLPVTAHAGPNDEIFLNIRYRLRAAEDANPAGHLIASGQWQLKTGFANDVTVRPAGELTYKDENGLFTVNSPRAALQFNKQTGWLQSYSVDALPLLDELQGLTVQPWGILPRLQLFSTSTSSEMVIVRADYSLPEVFAALHVSYTLNAIGEVQVQQILEVDSTQTGPQLPVFGTRWVLPPRFDSVSWYGNEPRDEDGSRGKETGIYRQTIAGQIAPADSNASFTSVRWYRLSDKTGHGLQITADSSLLNISLRQNDSAGVTLHIDHNYRQPYTNHHYIYKMIAF